MFPAFKRKIIDQRGESTVLIAAIIFCLLLAGAYSLNAAFVWSTEARLSSLAKEVAARAGTFLPNPLRACSEANKSFIALTKDITGKANSAIYNDPALKVYLNSSGSSSERQLILTTTVSSPAPLPCAAPLKTDPSAGSLPVKIPVKSLTVHIEDSVNLSSLGLSNWAGWAMTLINIKAEATTQLIPTDVVLVIENSNSVVSPALTANYAALEPTPVPAFTPFATTYLNPCPIATPGANCNGAATLLGPADGMLSKMHLYQRQCFGQVTRDMKRAAVVLHDLLSASGTFRVGVVHTNGLAGQGPMITVPLTTHPTYRNSAPLPVNNIDSNYTIGGINLTQIDRTTVTSYDEGKFFGYAPNSDRPDTRCAALTDINFPVPNHPYRTILDPAYHNPAFFYNQDSNAGATNRISLKQDFMNCNGVFNKAGVCSGESTLGNTSGSLNLSSSHLSFKYNNAGAEPRLLPRELIWIMNSGINRQSGTLLPHADYVQMQFAIQRAIDMLNQAPTRGDGLEVRRKVVLVLTDGVEDQAKAYDALKGLAFDTDFDRYSDPKSDSAALESYNYFKGDESTQYADGSTKNLITLHAEYCSQQNSANEDNPIWTITEPGEATAGIKLGVMLYGFRDQAANPYNANDPLLYIRDLADQGGTSARLDQYFRTDCNTQWGAITGRFWTESSIGMSAPFDTPQSYYQIIAPRIARSLFTSVVLK